MKAVPSSSKFTNFDKVRGSVVGSEVLELAKQQEKKKLVKIKAKEKRLKKKGDQVELFYKCKIITELWWITMPRKWSETVPKSQKDHEKQLF